MQSAKRYHPALVTMHWLIALLVFVNLYLGIVVFENRGGGPGDFQAINPLVTVHMAVGVTIIVLLIVRFILRVRTNRPVEATTGNKFFDSLAKFVHYGLYVTVLAVTVLGLVFSLQTGRFQSAFLGADDQFTLPQMVFLKSKERRALDNLSLRLMELELSQKVVRYPDFRGDLVALAEALPY